MSFKEEVQEFLLKTGVACSEGGWVWGWRGYEEIDSDHTVGCHWVATEGSEVIDYSFSEFDGTDSDNLQKSLLALTHVNCQCGKLKDVTLGVEGGTMTLLQGILGIRKEHR
jgi:hypothetical protein